ncbi:MAG: peptidase S10 [Akkermansiaceae bacterium]|nr:peptidase S10 [Akkermansiaceae bacterium]
MKSHIPSRMLVLGLLLLPGALSAEEKAAKLQEQTANKAAALPEAVTREGSVKIGGKVINYELTAGSMRIERDKQPADIFYVAYQRITDNPTVDRPVMFAFNGGPGSSAVWLHIGMLGPKILNLPGDGTTAPKPPVTVRDNPQSLLDVCDLVFVDPVSTGYSRPGNEDKAKHFHGVDADIEACGEFIRRWITENDRWASPKYLLGESYGGIRVAGLAQYLQSRHGMGLNGVVLLSVILDFATIQGSNTGDLSHSIFLPAYAAVAHHHGKLEGDRDQLVDEAGKFAYGDYASALMKGVELDNATKTEIAERLSSFSGIATEVWLRHNLRIQPTLFRAELLRDEGKTLGRFDGRVAWDNPDPTTDDARYDPSYSLALGAFSTALKDYLGREIGYKLDEPYEILTSKVHPWKWGRENTILDVSDRLATAMRDNPHLKVLVMSGHTDLATPPECVAYSLRHLHDLPAAQRDNIRTEYYEGGHMFYLNPPDLKKSRADLLEFLESE